MKMARTLPILLMAAAALLSSVAGAQERPFPPEALRGKMTPDGFPLVTIDGKERRLAAGARIFNQDNLIEVPSALRGRELEVKYTVDAHGEIDRIWLLRPEEAARPPAK